MWFSILLTIFITENAVLLGIASVIYKKIEPQLKQLWAAQRRLTKLQHHPLPFEKPNAVSINDPAVDLIHQKHVELSKAQTEAGFKLVDVDHVMKVKGEA